MNQKIKIGLTHGDFNGIGYEVMQKALLDEQILDLCTPIVYGDEEVWNFYKKLLGHKELRTLNLISRASQAKEGEINFIQVETQGTKIQVKPGEADRYAGTLATRALIAAREDVTLEYIDAVVTAPINKDAIQSKEFQFNGHTEFFSEPFTDQDSTMLFTAGELRVALLTMHMPLSQVSSHITLPNLTKSIAGLARTLKQDYGIEKPKIAVLGINPHAGEQGLLGNEEEAVIIPAIKSAWAGSELVFGPFSSDGYWGSGDYNKFDATLAIYHDQGLIPFKLLAMSQGVNVTAGLPIIRTSPDHGTAYGIAGKGEANEISFRNAIYEAIDIYRRRKIYMETTKDPLQKRYVDRGKDNVKLDLSKSSDEE